MFLGQIIERLSGGDYLRPNCAADATLPDMVKDLRVLAGAAPAPVLKRASL